jgi:hypothetical protein
MNKLLLVLSIAATTAIAFVSSSAATNTKTAVSCDRPCIIVCGSSACNETYNAAALAIPFAYSRSVARAGAAAPQPYYVITQNVPPGENTAAPTTYFIPGASLIRIAGGKGTLATWTRVSSAAATALRTAAEHVPAYPAPTKLTHVIVDHSLANAPDSYLRLWTLGKPIRTAAGANGWLPISMASDQASPWTDGLISLAVSRRGAYVQREGHLYAVPAAVASRARAGRSIPK